MLYIYHEFLFVCLPFIELIEKPQPLHTLVFLLAYLESIDICNDTFFCVKLAKLSYPVFGQTGLDLATKILLDMFNI